MKQSAINLAPVSVKLHIPVLSKIESSYQYPLYAKILFLGESSVGKTHLILTLIGQEYNINQGSTIGVDEFYLQVKIGNIHYNTQLCIWDLGGQVNYRIVNELWLHDVSCFVLTYDITRPQTFADLRFWMQALQSSHSLTESKIILVGNKIDVGGTAISRDEIQKFCTEFGIKESIIVSAKTKEKCQDLLKLIINQVDWTNLLGDFDGKTYNEILEYIRHLAQREKIIKSHDLIAKIAEKLHNTDLILIKSLIRKYVTQNLLTIGSSDEYYLLDSVYISKLTAETIRLARKNNGQVQKNELLLSFKLSRTQIDILFEYLVQEHIGYLLNKTTFIYPSFLPHDVPTIDPDIQLILDSDPHEIAYKMEGPMDLFVNRFFVQLSIELGSPSVLTNQLGVWVTGAGHQKTATFISTVLGAQEHLIRLKFGGGDQEKVKGQVIHLFQQLCEIYQLKSHS